MYVLDSSALIEGIIDGPRSQPISDSLTEEEFLTTSVCVHEILIGARNSAELFVLKGILHAVPTLDYTKDCAVHSAQIERELKREGKLINKMDILIAAICKASNATLITLDKDFEKIKGLKVKVIN
ncbi:type II toxin-antitoxin system VapC family toxin [Candidatus Woesearchaeota archaeon]|nr:type II toxin-antitoxin system VapC family toxin [Candidatus Woesearchaeota archaeon]